MMKKKKKNIMMNEIYFFQFIFFNFYKLINRIFISNKLKMTKKVISYVLLIIILVSFKK